MSFKENTQQTVQSFYGPMMGMRKTPGDFGVEIELEGENIREVEAKGWTPHQDNSLRGPRGVGPGGIEYTTRGAVPLSEVHSAVTKLRNSLTKAGAVFRDDSPRTSTHIHLNAQECKWIDVFGFITVFAAVEPLFLHLCGPRRDGNSFCCPSYDTGDLPDWFQSVFKQLEQARPGEFAELSPRGKYASLGTFRLHDLGTLECRCFPSSIDPDTIQQWCQWLMNIKTTVEGQEDKSFRGLIKQGIHDPMVLARSIFGETQVSPYLAAELINYGSREAYELTRILKFYLNKLPNEKKSKTLSKSEMHIIDDFVHPVPVPEWENMAGAAPATLVRRRRGFGE